MILGLGEHEKNVPLSLHLDRFILALKGLLGDLGVNSLAINLNQEKPRAERSEAWLEIRNVYGANCG